VNDKVGENKAEALAAIAAEIARADVAPELRAQATQLVFGAGSPDAQIVFVGEAPGKNEDLGGEPFVGAAGKLLNELLASVGLHRDDVYITNIVKYRPPANRDPSREEIEAFKPYLLRQIDVIQPKVVVLLGRHALSVFLPELTIGEAHGRAVHQDGRAYLPLYHPAAAIYNRKLRPVLFDDFGLIPAILGQEPTKLKEKVL
jgi:DNA polymerase